MNTISDDVTAAINTVISAACAYGENIEEGFPGSRISPQFTDEEARKAAGDDELDQKLAIQIRDLWRAVARLNAFCDGRAA